MEPIHSIQMASRLTGLSQNLIRAWEQRYRAVEPGRSPTKRRLYTHAEIERLSLLKELTEAGHSIGHIAKLGENDLRELLASARLTKGTSPSLKAGDADLWVREALTAIQALDASRLDLALKNAAATLGTHAVLLRVVAPLAETLGEWWRDGRITAAHEHFGTGIIRDFLRQTARQFAATERGPVLVVATPTGQLHEMGALMAGALAANLGWRVTHLGTSLPAAEIAAAARQKGARAVALSLIFPDDDPELARDLELLRQLLPDEVALIAGGRALKGYRALLQRIGAFIAENLGQLGAVLDQVRAGAHLR